MEKLPARPPEDRPRDRTEGAKAAREGCGYFEGGQVARDRDWHGAAHLKRAWLKALTAILPLSPSFLCVAPRVGGTFWFQIFIQAPSPEIWSETISGGEEVLAGKWGGLFMGYLLGKNFRRRDRDSSRAAQEDGCSSLPCRGMLSFRSGAREASGSETPRVHNVAWWCGGVAARGAGAAGGDATGRGVHASFAERPGDEGLSRRSRAGACAPRMEPKPQSATHISHLWRRRPNCQCRGGGLGETES